MATYFGLSVVWGEALILERMFILTFKINTVLDKGSLSESRRLRWDPDPDYDYDLLPSRMTERRSFSNHFMGLHPPPSTTVPPAVFIGQEK